MDIINYVMQMEQGDMHMIKKGLMKTFVPWVIRVLVIFGPLPAVSHADTQPPADRMSFATFANVTDSNYSAVNSGGGPGKIVVRGIAVDSNGNIFTSSGGVPNGWQDNGSSRSDNIIRKISPAGAVSRFTDGQEQYGYGGYVALTGDNKNYYTTYTGLSERLMHSPRGIAIDSYNNLYFADQGDNSLPVQSARVVKVDSSGSLKKVFMAEDTGGHTYSNFHEIQDLAVENGILYTLNMWTDKMVVTQFKSEDLSDAPAAGSCVGGNFVLNGRALSEPKGICVKDGKLYIADTGNSRIIRVDVSERDGSGYAVPKSAAEFDLNGLGLGSVSPQDVAADSQGNMYLTDAYFSGATYNYRVIKLDPNGNLLTYGGTSGEGTEPDQFNTPQQIAVGNNGNVYVADWLNYRVQVYTPGAPSAPALLATVSPGAANNSVKAAVTGTAAAKFMANITDDAADTPKVGDAAPSIGANLINSYDSGTDITGGVAAGKWLQIYDVDSDGKIVKFYQKQLAAEDIKAPVTAPSIATQPTDITVTAGQTASFTVAATGTAPLSYQWKKGDSNLTDGGSISGATTATLSIISAQSSDAGSYCCYVSNAAGNATSDRATLTVNTPPPVNTAPTRKSGVPAAVTADVAVNGTYSLNLSTVFADIDDDTLSYKVSVNGAAYTAANENYSYTPTVAGITTLVFKSHDGTADSDDTYTVTLTASNDGGEDGESGGGDNNGSSGSSGNGGSGTPEVPPYQATVSGTSISEIGLSVSVNTSAGSASVEMPAALTENIFGGSGTRLITVPAVSGVSSYTLNLPADSLSGSQGESTLTFSTVAGSINIPPDMLTGASGISGNKAEISIGQADKAGLPDSLKKAIGDKPLISLSLSIDGKQADWSNPSAPVTVSIPYTPTAAELGNPENIVVWYIDGGGNAVCVPNGRYDPATGTVTFSTTHFSLYAVSYRKVSFNDVANNSWYAKAVSFIAARDITNGTGGANFSPDAFLTRGEFIVMLMRAYNILPDANPTDNFSDAGNAYYTNYLAAAKRLGISAGIGNNMFAPDKEITRQEMFTLLYNTLKTIGRLPQGNCGRTLSSFSDAGDIAPWAKDALTLLIKAGTVSGSAGMLAPLNTATRAEMAQVLYNLL